MSLTVIEKIVGIDCNGLADDAFARLQTQVLRSDPDRVVLVARQPGTREAALKGELERYGRAAQLLASRAEAPAGVRWLLDRASAPA